MSYVRIWIHLVFCTKNREPLITPDTANLIYAHIKENAKLKEINIDEIMGDKDHIHCLTSLRPDDSISKVAQLIKGESSYWINKNHITKTKFEWADEYFAVSISESAINSIRNYIRNQTDHHRKKTFTEEYDAFIKKYAIKDIIQYQTV